MLTEQRIRDYEKQGYRIVGKHSAMKVCMYCKKAMTGKDVCYKNTFYGIESWRCVQMSPTFRCDHRCFFCWRDIQYAYPKWVGPVDDPKFIVDGCIKEHIKYLQGFGGNPQTVEERFRDMGKPLHFAISLTGEPCMYPKLPEMIDELKKRKITSFLVTNGTIPTMIEKLIDHQPTQLYIGCYGPDPETHRKVTNPITNDAWEKLQKSLSMMKHFKRSVMRLTLTKGYNMVDPKGYAELIEKYKPMFVEAKGYMWVGHSRARLEKQNMPFHEEIKQFAQTIADNSSYKIIDMKENSAVVLLMQEDKEDRLMKFRDESSGVVI